MSTETIDHSMSHVVDLPAIVAEKPTRHQVNHGGLLLSYLIWGDTAKPPVLLLHGGKDHCRNWDWTVAQLLPDYCCITPDLRGHGDSAWPTGTGYETPLLTADLAAIVDSLPQHGIVDKLALIGHSLGGIIVLNYAAIAPKKVRSVIAIEGLGASAETYAKHQAEPPATRLKTYVEKLVKSGKREPRYYEAPEDLVTRMSGVHKNLSPTQARHLALHGGRQYRDGWRWKYDPMMMFVFPVWMTSPDQYGELFAAIEAPTLLMRGEDSWASDPQADGRMKAFQNVRFKAYPQAGHWLQHDQFESFIEDVKAFLIDHKG